jgi:hypothetical protein
LELTASARIDFELKDLNVPKPISRRDALRLAAGSVGAALLGCSSNAVPFASDSTGYNNRIVFPESPWAFGHAIRELVWSAHLQNDSELRFDLHLVSADYYAEEAACEGTESDEIEERDLFDDAEEAALSDWESKIVWFNFYRCILSSTQWRHRGFVAATRKRPLDFAALGERVFNIDPLPASPIAEDRAFGIYLLGDDGVAGHELQITPSGDGNKYSLRWQGRIAQEYSGDHEFRYAFEASADNLTFAGIRLDDEITTADGLRIIKKLVTNLGELSPVERSGQRWLVLT